MQKLSLVIIAAIAVQGLCGHEKHNAAPAPVGKPAPIAVDAALPTSRPVVIDESGRTKSCPEGFGWISGSCVKQVLSEPTVTCPSGFVRGGKGCVKYTTTLLRCPDGFMMANGSCVKVRETEEEVSCPPEYVLTIDETQCVKQVQLPNVAYCPPGQQKRGQYCVKQVETVPDLYCPPNYKLVGHRCATEETYDCSPVESKEMPQNYSSSSHKHLLRQLGHKHTGATGVAVEPVVVRTEKAMSPTVITEKVVEKLCKRTRVEEAKKVCPQGSFAEGKGCVYEEQQPLLQKPGGFSEDFAALVTKCPEGFAPNGQRVYHSHKHAGSRARCVAKDETLPELYCPYGSKLNAGRCFVEKLADVKCENGAKYDDRADKCAKTYMTAPIVEYTVTYKCKGADCDA